MGIIEGELLCVTCCRWATQVTATLMTSLMTTHYHVFLHAISLVSYHQGLSFFYVKYRVTKRSTHTHTHRRAKEIFHLTGSLLQCLWKSGLGKVEARSLELCPGLPHGMGTSTWDIFHCIPKHTSRQQDWDWSSRPASLTVPQCQTLFKVTVSLSVAWLQHSCLYLLAWQSLFLKFSFLPGILMILPSWVLVNSPSSPPPHSPPSGSSLLLGLGVIRRLPFPSTHVDSGDSHRLTLSSAITCSL